MDGTPDLRDLESRFSMSVARRLMDEGDPVRFTADFTCTYFFDGKRIGHGCLLMRSLPYRLEWYAFYPYSDPSVRKRLRLGTLAHARTMLALDSDPGIPRDAIITHNLAFTSHDRRAHLAAMGIDWRKPLPLEEYVGRSVRYARAIGFSLDRHD